MTHKERQAMADLLRLAELGEGSMGVDCEEARRIKTLARKLICKMRDKGLPPTLPKNLRGEET